MRNVMPLLDAALMRIQHRLIAYTGNQTGRALDPFDNTGDSFSNDVFEAKAYDWGEGGNQGPNFQWKNLKVYWYKYLGRGMETRCTEPITPNLVCDMLNECLDSLPLKD